MRNPLQYLALPALQSNYIWLVTNGSHAVVVDPGEAACVKSLLDQSNWQLSAILLTHHHHDHIGGVANLLRTYDVPVYGPAHEPIEEVTQPVQEGDIVRLDKLEICLNVLDIPGHTRGHIAFFQAQTEQESPHLFCGDTLFASGCGRLFEGTPEQMLASLDKLAALPGATYVHCAHEYTLANLSFALVCEPDNLELQDWQRAAQALREKDQSTLPTTLGHEKRVNPFLRTANLALQRRLTDLLAVPVNDRLQAFTVMREWKDRW